jgi:hypothetical protein
MGGNVELDEVKAETTRLSNWAHIATVGADGIPDVVPVWPAWQGDTLWIFTGTNSVKTMSGMLPRLSRRLRGRHWARPVRRQRCSSLRSSPRRERTATGRSSRGSPTSSDRRRTRVAPVGNLLR